MTTRANVVGLLVGGRSSRMGGEPKGLLPAPDGSARTLVTRLADEVRAAVPKAEIVLVGSQRAYQDLPWTLLPDARADCGPLGGLVALLRYARAQSSEAALVFSCDLPYLTRRLVRRLNTFAPEAAVVCPRTGKKYDPLVARYAVRCLGELEEALAQGHLALQPLLRAADTRVLPLSEEEAQELRDWDTAEDFSTSKK